MILMLLFDKKNIFSTIFLIIKFYSSNEGTLDSCNNLHSFYDRALYTHSPQWDTWFQCFVLTRKAIISTIVLKIKIYLLNRINLVSHNNLHFFVIGHYKHIFLIRIPDIDALDWQEKLFIPLVSLESKVIHRMRQT